MNIDNIIEYLLKSIGVRVSIAVVGLFSFVMLFSPSYLLDTFHLEEFAKNHGFIFGISFLIFLIYYFIIVSIELTKKIIKIFNNFMTDKKVKSKLLSLNYNELRIILSFIIETGYFCDSVELETDSGALVELINCGILIELEGHKKHVYFKDKITSKFYLSPRTIKLLKETHFLEQVIDNTNKI